MHLQPQKWSFWRVSVDSDHRFPAELPPTAENYRFSSHWLSVGLDSSKIVLSAVARQNVVKKKVNFGSHVREFPDGLPIDSENLYLNKK